MRAVGPQPPNPPVPHFATHPALGDHSHVSARLGCQLSKPPKTTSFPRVVSTAYAPHARLLGDVAGVLHASGQVVPVQVSPTACALVPAFEPPKRTNVPPT